MTWKEKSSNYHRHQDKEQHNQHPAETSYEETNKKKSDRLLYWNLRDQQQFHLLKVDLFAELVTSTSASPSTVATCQGVVRTESILTHLHLYQQQKLESSGRFRNLEKGVQPLAREAHPKILGLAPSSM